MAKLIEIFKPGRHTAMSGATLSFSEADVRQMAQAYDPAVHEAPLVVGHPKEDAPAYGWVKSLNYSGGTLQAEPGQVDAQFAELVRTGKFKKISASFYTPDSPSNPKPGVYYLRHVGFLGAQPPAVKGLKSASFADAEQGVIEFGDFSDMQNAGLWRRAREWIIGKFGLDEADKVIPDYAVASLEEAARAEPADEPTPNPLSYSEPEESTMDKQKEAAIAAREQAIADQEAAFAEREKKLRAEEAKARRAGVAEFIDGLVRDGKVLPVHKAGLMEFMAGLSDQAVVEFGEGDGKTSKPASQWFREYLAAQPKVVEFKEAAPSGKDAGSVEFAAPQGYGIDAERMELHTKAVAYQREHKVSYEQAVAAVGK